MNFKILFIIIFIYSIVPISHADTLLKMNVISSKPSGYLNSMGELTGFHVDFFSHLEKVSGIKIEKHLFPFARGWRNIKEGTLDGGLLFKVERRAEFLVPVQFMFKTHVVAVGRKGIEINSIQDLLKYRIGKVQTVAVNEKFTELLQDNFHQVTKYSQLVRMLATGRIDVAVGNYYTIYRLAEELNISQQIEFPGLLLVNQDVWFFLSKKSKHLKDFNQLQVAAKKISESDFIDTLFKKYYSTTPSATNLIFDKNVK